MYQSDSTGYDIHTGRYRSRFDGLDAVIESRNFRYKELGVVESVHETGRDLYRKFNGERGVRRYEAEGGGRNAAGMMYSNTAFTTNGPMIEAYGFREKQRTRMLDDFVYVHEQVHGLHAARNITDVKSNKEYKHGIMLLEDQMRADGYDTSALESRRDFAKLRGEKGSAAKEFVANFGAFYRMEKLGYSEQALRRHAMRYNAPQMREAYIAFQEAKSKRPAEQPVRNVAPSLEDRIGAADPGPIMRPAGAGLGGAGLGAAGRYDLYDVLMEFFQLLRWYMRGYTQQAQEPQRYAKRQQQAYAPAYA